jgi:hypothetical protein
MEWMRNLNILLGKEKIKEKILKRENDEISEIPIKEYIEKTEIYLFELNLKYNTLKNNLNDVCKNLNEKHKNCLKLQDEKYYYKKGNTMILFESQVIDSSLLLRVLQNEETYLKFLHYSISLKSEEACSNNLKINFL